jgi:pimeloyl-ACP methyl ester carboxylesterase
MACTTWGGSEAPPVVCVHGLTRQGRDFDALAQVLAENFYVVCPDLPGRGHSDWLPAPALYQPPVYALALSHLLAFLDRPVRWVGTSLGGICGMILASAPKTPIERMVLNDIGPFIPREALARIAAYIGDVPDFADLAAIETYLRRVHAPFGQLTEAQWAQMAQHSARTLPDGGPGGGVTLHYDPALSLPMRAAEPQNIDMWPLWDHIGIPVLAIRGAESDLLLPETLERMAEKAETHVVENTGHAPALMDAPTIEIIRDFMADQKSSFLRKEAFPS